MELILSLLLAQTLATGLKGGYQVVAADLNRDGKPDLIALASGMDELVWFENPGWQRHVLARGFRQLINVWPMDTNGDGIPELLVASEFSNEARKSIGLVSLLECTGDPKDLWRVTEIDRLPASHRIRAMNGVFVNAPLTASDAQGPEYRGHIPLVYYRPGEWKRQMLNNEDEGVMHGFFVTDWNGDGLQDLLTASFTGIHLLLTRKDGGWTRSLIAEGHPDPWPKSGSSDITVGKLGKRRFLAAIEPWHGNEVAVYQLEGKTWKRNVIDSTLVDGHTILAADFDGDGRDEIIAGCRRGPQAVYLYRWVKNEWHRQPVDEGGMAAAACTAVDLNGDGKPELACIGTATANLKVYDNLGTR